MSRKFFKNAGLLAITEILLRLKFLIIVPLLTRLLGSINYGVWLQVGIIATTVAPLVILGMDSSIIRYAPGRPLNEQKRFFSTWLIFGFSMALFACLLIFIFKHKISILFFGQGGEYEKFIPLALMVLIIGVLLNIVRSWFRILNDAKAYSLITLTQSALSILPVILVLLFRKGAYDLVLYSIFFDFIIVIWVLFKIGRNYGFGPPDFSVISKLLKFGIPLVPAGYAIWCLNSADRLFLVQYSTMSQVGIYGLAYALGYAIIQITVSPIWYMYPNSASELYDQNRFVELKILLDRSIKFILLLTLPAITAMVVMGNRLLMIISTKEFITGAQVISIVAGGYLFSMIASYYDIELGLVKKQYLATFSIVIACIANLGLNFLLIPKYNIFGAAWATLTAFFIQLLLSSFFAYRYTRIKIRFDGFGKISLASVLMGAVIYIASIYLPNSGVVPFVVLAVLGIAVYALIIIILKVVKMDALRSLFAGAGGKVSLNGK